MKFAPRQTFGPLIAISLVGLVVGLITAFATIGFVNLVEFLNQLLYIDAASRARLDDKQLWPITIAVLTLGGLIVGLILRYGTDNGQAEGPQDSIYAVQLQERLPKPTSGFSSTAAAILSLGCGASVGQYGPLVYLGTLVGQVINRLPFGLRDMRNIAIACGVAAAISTAFNAPIAALVFTHEVILRHYSLRMFTAATVASACGYFVANIIFHHPPLFLIDFGETFRGVEFLLFALEGIACGMLAVVFLKLLQHTTELAIGLKIPAICKPMLAGFVLSLIALQIPEVLGAGQTVLTQATAGDHFSSGSLLLILSAKLIVTALCIGFGFAGGVIFPALLIGVLFGALFALQVPMPLLGDFSGVPAYAICGMAAMMSPIIGAPMTALLLVFEFTRSYEITVAAMLAIVFANLVAYNWFGRSLYDHMLSLRGIDLSMGRERAYLMHHKVIEHATAILPVLSLEQNIGELRKQMELRATASAAIVSADQIYQGLISQHQLQGHDDRSGISALTPQQDLQFDQHTSIWAAMEAMRNYLGEAVPLVDSDSGAYLGAIPEAVVIDAYLDAAHELRREEYQV